MRKAQVSVFMIIGVLLIIFVFLLLSQPKENFSNQTDLSSDVALASRLFSECFQAMTEEYVWIMGVEGGNLFVAQTPFTTQFYIRDWLVNGTDESLSVEEVEKTLADALDLTIDKCVKTYLIDDVTVTFASRGSPITRVSFLDNELVLSIDYPVRAALNNAQHDLERFSVRLPVRMKRAVEIAQEITSFNAAHPDKFSEDFLSTFDMNIDVQPELETGLWLFTLTDPASKVNGREFTFMFGQRYEK